MLGFTWQPHMMYTDLFQVISQLLAGDEITVVAEGAVDGDGPSIFLADGYTSFTGMQIRAGLE